MTTAPAAMTTGPSVISEDADIIPPLFESAAVQITLMTGGRLTTEKVASHCKKCDARRRSQFGWMEVMRRTAMDMSALDSYMSSTVRGSRPLKQLFGADSVVYAYEHCFIRYGGQLAVFDQEEMRILGTCLARPGAVKLAMAYDATPGTDMAHALLFVHAPRASVTMDMGDANYLPSRFKAAFGWAALRALDGHKIDRQCCDILWNDVQTKPGTFPELTSFCRFFDMDQHHT